MRIMSLLLPLALFACGEKEEVEIEGPIDADNDGFNDLEDCDDSQASINPGAFDSVGDDVDQNCDGIDGIDYDLDGFASVASGGTDCDDNSADVTEGSLWYTDTDGDGFGNDEDSFVSCESLQAHHKAVIVTI